jgi:hypothetical protein
MRIYEGLEEGEGMVGEVNGLYPVCGEVEVLKIGEQVGAFAHGVDLFEEVEGEVYPFHEDLVFAFSQADVEAVEVFEVVVAGVDAVDWLVDAELGEV